MRSPTFNVVRALMLGVGLCIASPALAQAGMVPQQTLVTRLPEASASHRTLDRRVTIDIRDGTLERVLSEITRQSQVTILYSTYLVPTRRRMSLSLVDAPVMDAIRAALEGTNVSAEPAPGGAVMLVRKVREPAPSADGTISGRITNAENGQPLPGANVLVQNTNRGALANDAGVFQIPGVPPGTYTLEVRRLGYAKATRQVTVGDGQTVTMDVALTPTTNPLSEVVVTGTVVSTEQKQLPSPITVIGADEIERKNAVKVDQLLRGSAPGIMTWDQGPIDYYAQVGSIRGASTFGFNAFKVYVDGVETSDPRNINTIDPESIERIEIVRGPQASTLYGSQALAGVMQIFTKKGTITDRPVVSGKVALGMIDTKWVSGTPLSQDYSLGVAGGQPGFNYNFGGTLYRVGAYLPEASTKNSSAYGSLHGTQGRLDMDLSGRYYGKRFDWPLNPILRDKGYAGWSKPQDQHNELTQQTYGLRLAYALSPAWQHNLTLGYDQNVSSQYNGAPRRTTPADTFMTVSYGSPAKTSIAYNTSYQAALGSSVTSTITAGLDHWLMSDGGYIVLQSLNNDGTLVPRANGPMAMYRMRYRNTGYFSQVMLGFADALFLTGGIRGEKNDNFGKDYGVSWSPRIGASLVHDFGGLTMKARGSYGRAIKPPDPTAGEGSARGNTVFLANTGLAPEQQVGFDTGLELYFGNRASFQTTYYNQTAIDLIDLVQFPPLEPTKVYYKWENVGRIKNKGWEFQGDLKLSPITLHATYSITDSRVRKLSPTYTGVLKPGDRMLEAPYTSGGATISYALPNRGRTSLDLGVTFIGHQTNTDYISLYGLYYGGQPYRGSLRDYWMEYPTVTKYNLTVTHTFSPDLSAFLRADNLTGNLKAERDNTLAQRGRWTMLGFRFKY